jgi:hypothetical protein
LIPKPNKKTPPLLRNGVYSRFQTIQPPGYPKGVTVRVDGDVVNYELFLLEEIV